MTVQRLVVVVETVFACGVLIWSLIGSAEHLWLPAALASAYLVGMSLPRGKR